MRDPKLPKGTLRVGTWSSTCNDCGKSAVYEAQPPTQEEIDRVEALHASDISYDVHLPGPAHAWTFGYPASRQEGCGVTWRYIVMDYFGGDESPAEAAARFAPDLEFIDVWG